MRSRKIILDREQRIYGAEPSVRQDLYERTHHRRKSGFLLQPVKQQKTIRFPEPYSGRYEGNVNHNGKDKCRSLTAFGRSAVRDENMKARLLPRA